MAFTNNYSTSFRWWDRIFGTDDKYREYMQKVRASKKAMKNMSKEEQLKEEQRLIDEVEKEGLKAEEGVLSKAKTE